MKSLVGLLEYLLLDCGRRSGARVHRDVETLRARARDEGDSFITITLPTFCRDFERCLDTGWVVPGLFLSFGKEKSGIPKFLSGFLHHVFLPNGVLRSQPSIDCIRFVRQICLFGKKLQRPCSEERELDAIEAYKRCEDEISPPEGYLWEIFRQVAAILLADFSRDGERILRSLIPRHGPGATEEHISGNQKWRFSRWTHRLEEVGFTYNRFGRAVPWHSPCLPDPSEEEWPEFVESGAEKPVRVVFVPKTLKTPRVIAVEPVVMQYAQQALKDVLVRYLERNRFTAGHVNFTDQNVNQALAKSASASRQLATLDMAEASDRVGLAHAIGMFESVPEFLALVLACRSLRARLPNGEILTLKKFASMGSAMCFPVEALVFFTSIIASRLVRAKRPVTPHYVHWYGRDVYVYGDDLIVPADEAPATCDDLESLGFKVNRHKSFWSGNFRESCGVDAFDYQEVTPVYLRRDVPTSRGDAPGIVSAVATCNQLHSAGYWQTATALRRAVENILGPLPRMPQNSPAIAWWHDSEMLPPRRWNRDLQRFQYRVFIPVSPRVDDPLDGWPALAKCFRLIGLSEVVEPQHLDRSPARYRLTLKRSWV